jgi:hypothetical protein
MALARACHKKLKWTVKNTESFIRGVPAAGATHPPPE